MEIDYEQIRTFSQLVGAYEQLAGRLRSATTTAHLGRYSDFDDLITENGHSLLIEEPRSGHDFIHVMTYTDQPKPFFVVPNERGKPGGSGSYYTASETLKMCLRSAVSRMATGFAWAECSERHGFDQNHIPEETYYRVLPEVEPIRIAEHDRLLLLLEPRWVCA